MGKKLTRKTADDDDIAFLEKVKVALEQKVGEVRSSQRLTTSPACLVAGQGQMSANMERLLKAAGQEVAEVKRNLELNMAHPIVQHMQGFGGRPARCLVPPAVRSIGAGRGRPARRPGGVCQTHEPGGAGSRGRARLTWTLPCARRESWSSTRKRASRRPTCISVTVPIAPAMKRSSSSFTSWVWRSMPAMRRWIRQPIATLCARSSSSSVNVYARAGRPPT